MLPYIDDFAAYIESHYRSAKKIVEIGIGWLPSLALRLARTLPNTEIVAIDIDPFCIEKTGEQTALKCYLDDIRRPDRAIYEGSKLMYSIRPPPELHPTIAELGSDLASDVIIKTISGEELATIHYHSCFQIMNCGRGSFHLARFSTLKATKRRGQWPQT